MSPYPSQIDQTTILDKARELLEAEGIDQLSLAKLADALEVKAPSLYRYFASKTALLQAINTATITDLISTIQASVQSAPTDSRLRITEMAVTYRAYAHAHPAAYVLAYSASSPDMRVPADRAEALVLPLQALMAEISGEDHSLAALRGLLALVHGFVMLEFAGQYRRGGDLSAAFEQSVSAYVAGWANLDANG